jgi:hypothetical protein
LEFTLTSRPATNGKILEEFGGEGVFRKFSNRLSPDGNRGLFIAAVPKDAAKVEMARE